MKKIFIAFVAVACALSACSDDDTADDLSRATISIPPDAIPAGPDGTTTQVTVTSSGDWRLQVSATGCILRPKPGRAAMW